MIRVEITEWTSPEPVFPGTAPDPNHPEAAPAEPRWARQRTLLLQDFHDLRIEPVVALLNNLDEADLCTCGHFDTLHEGKTGPCSAQKGNMLSCKCQGYETRPAALREELRDQLAHATKVLGQLEGRIRVQTSDMSNQRGEIERLTHSRDRLRATQTKKRKR